MISWPVIRLHAFSYRVSEIVDHSAMFLGREKRQSHGVPLPPEQFAMVVVEEFQSSLAVRDLGGVFDVQMGRQVVPLDLRKMSDP